MPQPLGSRVLVLQLDELPKTQTGLVVPDEAKDSLKIAKGRVVGIGDTIGVSLRIDDLVYFNRFSGERIKDSAGVEYLVLKDSELLAKD